MRNWWDIYTIDYWKAFWFRVYIRKYHMDVARFHKEVARKYKNGDGLDDNSK
ncbi:hypothetical protein [Bacillus phage CP-51]|uniref:Uncharacterized protein n=1 Tax=Bacillus phage CP-51 TaxID=1391188 RepID=A0A068EU37_9CAUD|nr:hypothetical protein OZ73_gp066 [Bacillus phage CP-51]AID50501.1 hypothetical protein [Bacillus phage CP-51]